MTLLQLKQERDRVESGMLGEADWILAAIAQFERNFDEVIKLHKHTIADLESSGKNLIDGIRQHTAKIKEGIL